MLARTLILALLFAGCVEGPGPRPGAAWAEGERDPEAALTTDSLWYIARRVESPNPYGRTERGPWYLLEVVARFLNVTPDTVVLKAVDGRPVAQLFLVSRSGEEVTDLSLRPPYGSHPGSASVWQGETITVPPGGGRVDTLMIWGPNQWQALNHPALNVGNGVWAPAGPMVGRMHLVYEQQGQPRPSNGGYGPQAVFAPPSAVTSNAFEVRLNGPLHFRPIEIGIP